MHHSASLLSEILTLDLVCSFDADLDQHKFLNTKIPKKGLRFKLPHFSDQK